MLTQNWLMVTNEFKLYKRGKYQIQCAANENKKTFSLLPLFVLLTKIKICTTTLQIFKPYLASVKYKQTPPHRPNPEKAL